jgi:predicted adenine nucleotide alpha hydrolase (AANH) superfamily ATPase
MLKMDRVLLHVCCAPCATVPVKRLQEKYEVTTFFYNPNIYPPDEYDFRETECKKYFSELGVPLIIGPYETDVWDFTIQGFENEPERGERCLKCYKLRLEKTAARAVEENIRFFTTTLTISPHKPFDVIEKIGNDIADKYRITFLAENFKKRDGFKESTEISTELGMYRQDYCGCKYSIR